MDNKIEIYTSPDGSAQIEVQFEGDTFWLSLNQISDLFEKDKSVISRHLKNIYQEGELDRDSTVAKNATVQLEAERQVKREIEYYNLDAIISNEALAGLTLFVAASKAEEMETVKKLLISVLNRNIN